MPKISKQQEIINKIDEIVEDYEKREELMNEVKRIKAKRLKRARSASQKIRKNIQRLQTMGLTTRMDFKTT